MMHSDGKIDFTALVLSQQCNERKKNPSKRRIMENEVANSRGVGKKGPACTTPGSGLRLQMVFALEGP